MPSKFSNKIKGIIFADHQNPRNNGDPPADDAQKELISGGGPGPSSSSDGLGGNAETREKDKSASAATTGSTKSSLKKNKQQPRQQQLLKEHRKEHNSSQQVHIWEEEPGGGSNSEPIKHYMHSTNNTPIRKVNGSGGAGELAADAETRILLNVGGVRHETHVTTLISIPYSRLCRLAQNHIANGRGKREYFFDRHPAVFNSIIDFYRTGELHVPLEVCGAVVKRELDFWQIDEREIKACCWRHYHSYIENQKILDSFKSSLDHEAMDVDLAGLRGWRLWQTRIWLVMDHPRTSKLALAYGITSFLFVAASIAGFCLETLPELRPKAYNMTTNCDGETKTISVVMSSHEALNVLDFICTVFFSLELVTRFTVSLSKVKFIINPMNIIDLLALVPLYVQVIFEQSDLKACYMNERFVIEIMFILRIFRMFRIFHLVKHYQALKVLVYSLKASLQELLMLFIFLLIATLIFSTMIYYAERSDGGSTQFNTIPMGFWWAIITMTTVGYGDVAPSTPIGYVVGTACSVLGVLLLALTFPVISNNFTLFYTHVRSRSINPRSREEESVWEDEDDLDIPDHPPDYGSISFKMQNLPAQQSSKPEPSPFEYNGAHASSVMNGNAKKTSPLDIRRSASRGGTVPLAKFSRDGVADDDDVFPDTAAADDILMDGDDADGDIMTCRLTIRDNPTSNIST